MGCSHANKSAEHTGLETAAVALPAYFRHRRLVSSEAED
jgi:hypothetical protein